MLLCVIPLTNLFKGRKASNDSGVLSIFKYPCQFSHSYQHQYLLIKTSLAVSANKTQCARREGSGKAGQDLLFHEVAETSNVCLARGGGYYGVNFCWVYAVCVSEPPLYSGFDRLCSKKYIQRHSPISLLLGSTPGCLCGC